MAAAAVRARPALVLNPLRITLTLAVVAGALYGLYTLVPWKESAFFRGAGELFLVLYIIDGVIIFLAVAGEPSIKATLWEQASQAFAGTDRLIRQVPLELFILSTLLSFTLKILLVVFIGVGITGMVQILLYIVLPWLLVSLFITAVWLGSFGATRRYWEWLVTAPPKAVIRNLFDMNTDALTCEHCEHTIPLVGIYECPGCKFKFKGHYFAWCPYCFQRFGYVNCPNPQCRLSRKRPVFY